MLRQFLIRLLIAPIRFYQRFISPLASYSPFGASSAATLGAAAAMTQYHNLSQCANVLMC